MSVKNNSYFDSKYLFDDMEKYNKNFNRELYENMTKEEIIPIFKDYYTNNLPVDLLTWSRVNEPKDEMLYKQGYWDQIIFIRDTIMPMICNNKKEYENNPALVINYHMSKSIILPVYQINLHGEKIKIILRNNFYDWKISVDSDIKINLDFGSLFKPNKKIYLTYCEGFKKEQVYDSYNNNKKQFTIEIYNNYELYTFMFLLKDYLNKQL